MTWERHLFQTPSFLISRCVCLWELVHILVYQDVVNRSLIMRFRLILLSSDETPVRTLCQMTIFGDGAGNVCKFDGLQVVDVTLNAKWALVCPEMQTNRRDRTISKQRKISNTPHKFTSTFEPSSSVSGVGDVATLVTQSIVLKQERFK